MPSTASQNLLNDKWDVVLSNTLIKTGLGFGGGVLASILFLKEEHSQYGWVLDLV